MREGIVNKLIDGVSLVIAIFIGFVTMWWVSDLLDTIEFSNSFNSSSNESKKINPKLILQERYARGEINSLEYLERMTRL